MYGVFSHKVLRESAFVRDWLKEMVIRYRDTIPETVKEVFIFIHEAVETAKLYKKEGE